jgi:CRP/FNR family transcriptional regulator
MLAAPEILRHTALGNTLRACRLFAGLPPEEIAELASIVVRKEIARGEFLFHEGAPTEGFFVVQSGSLNVHRVSPAGKEQVIHIFRPGESLAEAAVADDAGYPADARAEENSVVLIIPRAPFLDLLHRRPALAMRMLAAMNQHLRTLVARLDELTLKDVETRLAHWLLKRCPQPLPAGPVTIGIGQPKRVLAAEIGTVGETLSRTLARWRERGLIETHERSFILPDPPALDALVRRSLGEA